MDAKLAEYLKSDQPATIFEIYIKGGPKNEPGWDIRHVVVPFTGAEAIAAVKRYPKFDEIITRNDWFHKDQAVAFPHLEAFGEPPVKGHYVRLWSKDEDQNDCGVAGICKSCCDKGITHHQYDYEVWEMDLNGDKSECHICKANIN